MLSFQQHNVFEIHPCYCIYQYNSTFFLKNILFIYLFLEGRERRKRGKNHQCVVASHMPPTGDLARNQGMCPNWEWYQQPFDLQAGAQSTELHQPEPQYILFVLLSSIPLHEYITICLSFHLQWTYYLDFWFVAIE